MMVPRLGDWYVAERRMKFVFEIRTNFVLKGEKFEEIIDSEKYDVGTWENHSKKHLELNIGRRLRDYWISKYEIRKLTRKALAFAEQTAADPQYASVCSAMVPVAVDLDVCTVQQEGESMDMARERAITSEFLYPIHLCPVNKAARPKGRDGRANMCRFGMYEAYRSYLMYFLREGLRSVRVRDAEKGLALMEEYCCICYREPAVGVRLSLLVCGHCFHNSCIVRWLEDHDSCPLCLRQVHNMPRSSLIDEYEYEYEYEDGEEENSNAEIFTYEFGRLE